MADFLPVKTLVQIKREFRLISNKLDIARERMINLQAVINTEFPEFGDNCFNEEGKPLSTMEELSSELWQIIEKIDEQITMTELF